MTNRKVLIVDDYTDNLLLMQMILEKDNWMVFLEGRSSHVVEMALREQPHVIIMDINMPLVGGLEVCRLLKKNPKTQHIPVILFTTFFGSGVEDRVFEAGAAAFTTSPFVPDELRQLTNSVYRQMMV